MMGKGLEYVSINSGEAGEVVVVEGVSSPGNANEKTKAASLPNKPDYNKESRIKDFNFKQLKAHNEKRALHGVPDLSIDWKM